MFFKNKNKNKMLILIILFSLLILISIVGLYMKFAPQFGSNPDPERLDALAKMTVYKNKRFYNLSETPVVLPNSLLKIIKLQIGKNPGRIPVDRIPSVKPVFNDSAIMSVIWLGHSTVLVKTNNTIILTDPVFSKRASPATFAGPEAFLFTEPITPENIPFPDIIILSHDHFDHLDYKSITRYYKNVKTFLVPLGVRDHLVRWGISPDKIIEFDWWQSITTNGSLKITATPARHFSGRRNQNNSTLWCSWVIQDNPHKIYFCGDSGYGSHFREIGEKFGPFDLTLMECGAYGKYWPYIHMLPEQTVQAQIDLKGKFLLPIHWAKFNLSLHHWKEPIERLVQNANDLDINTITPLIGEAVQVGYSQPENLWWTELK
jgi:L-ascorbate metabolism protein UlaG (beta-lactamase superfamily)